MYSISRLNQLKALEGIYFITFTLTIIGVMHEYNAHMFMTL